MNDAETLERIAKLERQVEILLREREERARLEQQSADLELAAVAMSGHDTA